MHLPTDDEGIPDAVAARDHVVDELVRFTRTLRAAGCDVPTNASVVAARALAETGFRDRDRASDALRAALLTRPGDGDAFDRLFPAFWARLTRGPDALDSAYDQGVEAEDTDEGVTVEVPAEPRDADDPPAAADDGDTGTVRREVDAGTGDAATAEDGEDAATAAVYSPSGRSEPVGVDTADLDPDPALERAVSRLTGVLAGLRGRRWSSAGDDRIDTRRALRRSFGTGGTVLSVPRRDRKRSAVRAVLLVDVSRSVLDAIDRGFLVRFLRRVHEEWRDARIFFFDTSLREVTDAFDAPSPLAALRALDRAEAEWGGGTRIGHALDTLRREHPGAVDRETTAIVISDGLEVGEIDVLESGMVWLSRHAAGVLWFNPLAASPDYEPTCRGMAAARPFVDGLFAFTGPDDVAETARQLEQHGLHGRVGYAYDPRRREPAA